MDVVKLPKKVRMVCYEIMDGKEEALDTLESFADKYPHQVAAVKAEVAYFNLDYEKALALDLAILPWLEEWYYSNVSDEHMIAMTVAAIQLHREQELIEALTKEQARIRAENGLPQRDRFCDILMDYLTRRSSTRWRLFLPRSAPRRWTASWPGLTTIWGHLPTVRCSKRPSLS